MSSAHVFLLLLALGIPLACSLLAWGALATIGGGGTGRRLIAPGIVIAITGVAWIVGVGIAAAALMVWLEPARREWTMKMLAPIAAIPGALLIFAGTVRTVTEKGYAPALGLLFGFLSPVGLGLALLMPDARAPRKNAHGQRPPQGPPSGRRRPEVGMGFLALAGVSLLLGGWFVARESNSPGFGWGAGLLAMHWIVVIAGAVRSLTSEESPFDLFWLTVLLSAVTATFFQLFFGPWLPIAAAWMVSHFLILALMAWSDRRQARAGTQASA